MSHFTAPGHAAIRTLLVAAPLAEATALAEEMDADLATDAQTAERAVRDRAAAGRRAMVYDDVDDDNVRARAAEIREAAAVEPPLGAAEVDQLRQLAEDVLRAGRIRQRTEVRFAETLQAKVAASSGVALHPTAVLAAASAVTEAEAALTRAQQAGNDLGPEPPRFADLVIEAEVPGDPLVDAPADHGDPVLRRPAEVFDEAGLERRRSRLRALSLLALMAGLGIVALALGAAPVVGGGLIAIGVLAASLALFRGHRVTGALTADRADVEGNLANLEAVMGTAGDAQSVAGVEEPAVADEPAPPAVGGVDHRHSAWVERRIVVDAAREDAEERVRVARVRWHQLAGADADPYEPDAVVRAHDPQLAYSDKAAESSPTVRTVAAFHRKAAARWKVLWAAYGRDEAPEPENLEAVLDELLGAHRAAQADAARLTEAEGRHEASEMARRPLILVEPSAWWAPGRLDQLLSSVPPEGEVVLVERVNAAAG